jgi:hypothetical protein
MLTVSTPIPTSLRGKVRALVKAHAGWHGFLTEKAIISASARNADLLEFALRYSTLTEGIEQMLAEYEAARPAESAATLMLARRVEALLQAYTARTAQKPRIRVKARTSTNLTGQQAMTAFRLVYPEKRTVPEQTIKDWYADAVANDEIDDMFLHASDVLTMARGLQDAGIITFTVVHG